MGSISLTFQVWKRKVERNFQDYGLKVLLGRSLAVTVKAVYEHRRYRLYRINLCKPTETPAEIDGVTFRTLTSSDSAAIQQIEETAEWLKGTVATRLDAGACCLAAFEDGALAGFNLVSFGEVHMPLVEVTRTFRPDEAWSEQISTVRTFRKKGLASQLRFRMFELLRSRGIRTFYGGARIDNVASLGLARRVGFQEFAEIHFTRIVRSKRWRCVRVRP
jgi:RimJ/RimL family protein N-acetyltransferase